MTTRSRTALVCVVCLALIGGVIEGRSRTSDLSSLSIAISNAPTSSLPTGQPFTFTTTAEGSTDPLEYSFWLLDAAGWTCVRTYDLSPSLEWTPSKPGNYALQAWSRRIGKSDPYEAWTSIGFDVVTAPLTIQLTTTSSFPSAVSTPITWTARANAAGLRYQFWRLDGSSWTMVRDYSADPTFTWTPNNAAVGVHTLQVWARLAGSTAPYEAWAGTDFFTITGPPPPAPVHIESLTANASFPAIAGFPITWTATARGGTGSVEYQFWRLDGSDWTMVRDYQSSGVYAWQPGPADAGEHTVQVWARNAGTSAVYEAWAGFGSFEILAPEPPHCSAVPVQEGSCFQPVPSYQNHNYLADLVVKTQADIAARRKALIKWIWGSDQLPATSTLPADALETGVVRADIDALDLPNLARVDRFRIDVPIPAEPDEESGPISSYVYEFVPSVSNNRLLVLHQGHVAGARQAFTPSDMVGADSVLRMFLAHGYTVLYLQMPLIGDNVDPRFELSATVKPHDLLGARRQAGFNPLVAFVHPVRIAINYARSQHQFTDVTMLGISGGGWTTTVYAAVDPDVVSSFPVAGSTPLSMNHGDDDPCAHDVDWEQSQFPVAASEDDAGQPLGYLDLYLLGSTRSPGGPARQQVQILNRYDPCCFAGAKVEGTYETAMNDFIAALGGSYRLAIDGTHTEHKISECALSSIVLPAIERKSP
jgi:hypothetical protein